MLNPGPVLMFSTHTLTTPPPPPPPPPSSAYSPTFLQLLFSPVNLMRPSAVTSFRSSVLTSILPLELASSVLLCTSLSFCAQLCPSSCALAVSSSFHLQLLPSFCALPVSSFFQTKLCPSSCALPSSTVFRNRLCADGTFSLCICPHSPPHPAVPLGNQCRSSWSWSRKSA